MHVGEAELSGARHLETYRGTNIFQLSDGRVYLNGLIAVATLELARATLDFLAGQSSDA